MDTNGTRNSLSGQHQVAARPPACAGVNNPNPRLRAVVRDKHNGSDNHNRDGRHDTQGNYNSHRHNGKSATGLPRLPEADIVGGGKRPSDDRDPRPAAARSQDDPRLEALRLVAGQMKNLSWTPALFALLLDELYADDVFTELVGDPNAIPRRRYAHAVAVAIALRHSWRSDDLEAVVGRLGVAQTRWKRRDPQCAERRPRAPARRPA